MAGSLCRKATGNKTQANEASRDVSGDDNNAKDDSDNNDDVHRGVDGKSQPSMLEPENGNGGEGRYSALVAPAHRIVRVVLPSQLYPSFSNP